MKKDIHFEMTVTITNTDAQMSYSRMVTNEMHASDTKKVWQLALWYVGFQSSQRQWTDFQKGQILGIPKLATKKSQKMESYLFNVIIRNSLRSLKTHVVMISQSWDSKTFHIKTKAWRHTGPMTALHDHLNKCKHSSLMFLYMLLKFLKGGLINKKMKSCVFHGLPNY